MRTLIVLTATTATFILSGCGGTKKSLAESNAWDNKNKNGSKSTNSSNPAGVANLNSDAKAGEVTPLINVPLVPETAECSGPRLGIYSWDQTAAWRTSESALVKHLSGRNAKTSTCGDVTVNVADFSNSHKIYNSETLVPFIKNIRSAGNDGVVYLSYGDVKTKNVTACRQFIDTFFEWVLTVSHSDAKQIEPIGLSFDIEHFPIGETEKLLKYAQLKKREVLGRGFSQDGGIWIQWTIEGRVNPVDTDAVMKYADSALMMAYRNYMSKAGDEYGDKNGLLRRMSYMLKEQCKRCLDDSYARQNYRAKITVMVESSCDVEEYCDRVSFCAFDGPGREGGVDYLRYQLSLLDSGLVSSGLMTMEQKNRLMNRRAPYSVHHWEWFQCYYNDPSDSNKLCENYHNLATNCRG